MDVVDAEIRYFSDRIHSAQAEMLKQDGDLATEGRYENALQIIGDMDVDESHAMVQMILEDVVSLRMTERQR